MGQTYTKQTYEQSKLGQGEIGEYELRALESLFDGGWWCPSHFNYPSMDS